MPTPPDWLAIARPPGGGGCWALKVAFSRIAGSLASTPRQLGPTSRIPWVRASTDSSRWRVFPCGPSSPKPELITTAARTPAAAASSSADAVDSAGTAITARSTGWGTSPNDG